MKNKIAISQSNYIPWKGYFDLIASVDIFVLYDDMQFTKRDWRNRNKIKTPNGTKWLSIPVKVKGKYLQKICETQVLDSSWAQSHLSAIMQNYRDSEYYNSVMEWLKPLYLLELGQNLSGINRRFIESVCTQLGITTELVDSSEFDFVEGKTERLVSICQQLNATDYISGPAAKEYIDEGMFNENRIRLGWADYSNYPVYPQLWGEFEHSVSIIDLLFNMGPNAKSYLKSI